MGRWNDAPKREKVIFISAVTFTVVVLGGIVSSSGGHKEGTTTSTTLSAAEVRWIHNFRLGNWSACVPELNFAQKHYDVAASPDNIGNYEVILHNECSNLRDDDPDFWIGSDVDDFNYAFDAWDLELQEANGGYPPDNSLYRSDYKNLRHEVSVVAKDLGRY